MLPQPSAICASQYDRRVMLRAPYFCAGATAAFATSMVRARDQIKKGERS